MCGARTNLAVRAPAANAHPRNSLKGNCNRAFRAQAQKANPNHGKHVLGEAMVRAPVLRARPMQIHGPVPNTQAEPRSSVGAGAPRSASSGSRGTKASPLRTQVLLAATRC
jgi:hypothetical protein